MDKTGRSNTGCTSKYNWDTFASDMDGSLVKMTVSYNAAGVFTMSAIITTTAGRSYNYSYEKTIASKPSSINLFFVNEGSYIDGTNIPTNVNAVGYDTITKENGKRYNLSGQAVNKNYNGIVIMNGKKYINK